jgi:hypothetical protein
MEVRHGIFRHIVEYTARFREGRDFGDAVLAIALGINLHKPLSSHL